MLCTLGGTDAEGLSTKQESERGADCCPLAPCAEHTIGNLLGRANGKGEEPAPSDAPLVCSHAREVPRAHKRRDARAREINWREFEATETARDTSSGFAAALRVSDSGSACVICVSLWAACA